MLFITMTEYNNKRIAELGNAYYRRIFDRFARFLGTDKADRLMKKIGGYTLKEFDRENSYVAIGELFALV